MLLEDLPEDARLSYLIGEIVQWDVWCEVESRGVCAAFDRAGLTTGVWESDYGKRLPQLLTAIDNSGVPEPFRALAAQVGHAALRGHRLRNEYAHDILMPSPNKPDQIMSALNRRPPKSLSEFQNTAVELMRLTWRLRAIWVIAQSWIGPALDPDHDWQDADNLRSWTRVAMNHIADVPNQIRGTPGKCPEPPGGYQSFGD